MTQTKERNPFMICPPRFVQDRCMLCSCATEVLKFSSFNICRSCIKSAGDKTEQSDQAGLVEPIESTRTICSFCGIRYREILIANVFQEVKLKFAAGNRLGLAKDHCAICNECIRQIQKYFARRECRRRTFQYELGPECGPEKCVEDSCKKLRIKLAIRCLEHQFDQFEGL